MRLQLLHAHRDASFGAVARDLQHLGFNLLAYGKHIRGLIDAAPGDVADMEQSIHAPDIYKSTVVGEAADCSADDISFLYLCVAALPGGALFFFGNHAAV